MVRVITQRILNPYIGEANEKWASNILNMPLNPKRIGPDLIDNLKFVEVKSGNSPPKWTFIDEQIDYQRNYPDLEGFVLFVSYFPEMITGTFKEGDLKYVEERIIERESYLVPFSWLCEFKTRNGKHHKYTYPEKEKLPKINKTYKVKKGLVHIVKGVKESLFNLD